MAILFDLLLMVAVIYLPFFQGPFETYALLIEDWLIVFGTAITVSPVIEMAKWMLRRGWFGKDA